MKNTAILLLFFGLFTFACTDKTADKEAREVKNFFKSFQPVSLPYSIVTDAANHTIFQNLMGENHRIDSVKSLKYGLNTELQKADSAHADPIKSKFEGWNYYTIGLLGEKEAYKALLYGRNARPDENDAVIFLATFSPEGKKIDEIIFHKPLLVMPPTEIRRISEAKSDSTFTAVSVMENHKFVEKEDSYMELVRQVAYEKNYTIDSKGKITLASQDEKELSAKEIEAKVDSLSTEQ